MFQRMNLFCTFLALAIIPQVAEAQGLEYIKANYTKYEYKIRMRDGKRLFTAVYVPKDDSQTYPILLKRTPYSAKPYGTDQYPTNLGPSPLFGKEGYIFVYQDVRGRWMSEGEFVQMRPHRPNKKSRLEIDESSDTWDTVDWLVKNVRGNNGRVGIAGISYPGFYTAAGIIDSHPAIKAASPQAPVNDWFAGDDWHHNGAFFLAHMFNWMSRSGRIRPKPTKKYRITFDYGTPDGFEFFRRIHTLEEIDKKYLKGQVPFWKETMKHGTYDDFWKARNIRPHLKNIKPAVMTVGGWFDAENLFGALETYKSIEARNPNTFNMLVMGPWRHGGWSRGDGASFGDIPFNAKTSVFYREKIEFPFFQLHLKGKGQAKFPEAWVFELGSNQWRKYDKWPPRTAKRKSLYFHSREQLSFEKPANQNPQTGFDQYVSNPIKPVPYINKIATGMAAEYMIADQRFASKRPDVLVYQTPVLEKDVTLVGPIEVDLIVSTSGTDCDWVVKLIDVYPDDFPDPKPHAGPHGGLSTIGSRRHHPGQVPQQPGKTGTVRTEPPHPRAVHHARHIPQLPGRPPHHGAGAKLMVPPRRPQPTKVPRHLPRQRIRLPEDHPTRLPHKRNAFKNTGTGVAVIWEDSVVPHSLDLNNSGASQ
jgi:uncharacterized protein